ncbi:MAG: hypothetical protein SGBAC_011582 [Bacillariaceae sp.]
MAFVGVSDGASDGNVESVAVGRLLGDSEGPSDSGKPPVLGLIDGDTVASASGRVGGATAGALLIGSVFWVLLGFSVVTPFVGATEMMLGVGDGASDGGVESVTVGRLLGDSEGLSDTGEPVGMNVINGSLTGAIVVLKAPKLGEEVFTASVSEDGIIVGDRWARGSGVDEIGNQSRIGLPFCFLL